MSIVRARRVILLFGKDLLLTIDYPAGKMKIDPIMGDGCLRAQCALEGFFSFGGEAEWELLMSILKQVRAGQ